MGASAAHRDTTPRGAALPVAMPAVRDSINQAEAHQAAWPVHRWVLARLASLFLPYHYCCILPPHAVA
jgi:hypothetical protein